MTFWKKHSSLWETKARFWMAYNEDMPHLMWRSKVVAESRPNPFWNSKYIEEEGGGGEDVHPSDSGQQQLFQTKFD